MPTRWQTFPIELKGGLTFNLGRLEQGISAPGSATILQNFEPDVEGGYTRILGYQKFSEDAVTGTGQIYGVVALSTAEALVARDGKYYYSVGAGWTEKLTLANASIARIRADEFNFTGTKKTVVVDGVNAPAYFDHSSKLMAYAVGAPADVVGASRVKVFKSHLFFTKGRLLSFTAPFGEQDFSIANGAGVINVGDDITGLIVFRDQLIVFCLNKIFRLVGNTVSDFALLPITNNTGCLCGDTVQEVGGDVMYLGPDGIRYLSASERDNDFGLVRASEKIQTQVLQVTNANCIYSSVTIAAKNQYRLFYWLPNVNRVNSKGFLATKFSNQTADNIAWAELKGFKIYGISKYQDRDRETILFVSDGGFVYRMEAGNSLDGANIEAIFETPYMPINDPKIRKTFYKHTLYAKPTGQMSITASLRFDYQQSNSAAAAPFQILGNTSVATYGAINTTYGTAVYGSIAEEEYFNNVVGSGFVVALRYDDNSTRPPFNLNFVVLEYRTNERR
jgi:hypothetical protein